MLKPLTSVGLGLFLVGCVTSGYSTPAQLSEYKKPFLFATKKLSVRKCGVLLEGGY